MDKPMDFYRFPRVGTAAVVALVLAWNSTVNAQEVRAKTPDEKKLAEGGRIASEAQSRTDGRARTAGFQAALIAVESVMDHHVYNLRGMCLFELDRYSQAVEGYTEIIQRAARGEACKG
jgi:hypothetical protein